MTEQRTPAQQHYDRLGYYERQVDNPGEDSTYLAWAADMANTKRHCFDGVDPDNDNRPTRWLAHDAPEYLAAQKARYERDDYFLDDDKSWQICTVDHSDNPKAVGEIEWMRFIHTYSRLAPEGQRYFTENGQLWIDPTGQLTSDDRRLYAEVYFNRRPTNEDELPGFKFRKKFALFLDNARQHARMECYDPELTELCKEVYEAVQASYA